MRYTPGPDHAATIESHRTLLAEMIDLPDNDPKFKYLNPAYSRIATNLDLYDRIQREMQKGGETPQGEWVDAEYKRIRKAEKKRKVWTTAAAVVGGVVCAPISVVAGAIVLPIYTTIQCKDRELNKISHEFHAEFDRSNETQRVGKLQQLNYPKMYERMQRQHKRWEGEGRVQEIQKREEGKQENGPDYGAMAWCVFFSPIMVASGALAMPVLLPVVLHYHLTEHMGEVQVKVRPQGNKDE